LLEARSAQAKEQLDSTVYGWKDTWAALLFLGHVAYVLYIVIARSSWFWAGPVRPLEFLVDKQGLYDPATSTAFVTGDGPAHLLVQALFVSVVLTVPLAHVLVLLLLRHPLRTLRRLLLASVGALLATGFGFLALGSAPGFFFCCAAGLACFCYVRTTEHHLPFSAANLRVAARGFFQMKGFWKYALGFTALQVAWILAWNIAVVSFAGGDGQEGGLIAQQGHSYDADLCLEVASASAAGGAVCSCVDVDNPVQLPYTEQEGPCPDPTRTMNFGLFFISIISLYWGSTVIMNITHATVAGTLAHWWFSDGEGGAPAALSPRRALGRALSCSFGSLCFGSLVVAVAKTLQDALWSSRRAQNPQLRCLVTALLGALEKVVEVFNRYAFCYVAIYGLDFMSAGRGAMALFRRLGWASLVNDDVVSRALAAACLGVGLAEGALAFAVGKLFGVPGAWLAMTVWAVALCGYLVCWTVLNLAASAVTTVFVCFAEDPGTFQRSAPDAYMALVKAWAATHAQEMRGAGYII